jgi:hypothetical protein
LAYAVHPLGPRYDGVEHDVDFDPVDGHDLFIEVHATWAARPAACRWTPSTGRRSRWWRT